MCAIKNTYFGLDDGDADAVVVEDGDGVDDAGGWGLRGSTGLL